MKIIDRYIIVEFLRAVFVALITFVTVYIIVDLFDNISTFIDKDVGIFTVLLYYLYETPSIIGTIVAPVSVLLACFLSIGNLSRHFEIAGMRTSGMSLYRIVMPVFVVGIGLSIFMVFMNETLMIYTNNKKETLKNEKIYKRRRRSLKKRNVYYIGEKNRFYKIGLVDGKTRTLHKISIYTFGKEYRLVERIDARMAKEKSEERKVKRETEWIFFDGVRRRFKDGREEAEDFKEYTIILPESIEDFIREQKRIEDMYLNELKTYIDRLKRSGENVIRESVELHCRFSFPFMNFIVVLLGVPLACRVRRSGFVLGFSISLFCSFLYWGFTQTAKALGQVGSLSPYLSAWIPNFSFFVVGILLIMTLEK